MERQMQFIGYHIDGYDTDKTIPVSTGATREEAQSKAIQRILSLAIMDGSIAVQERPELSAEDFETLTKHLDDWFASKGVTV